MKKNIYGYILTVFIVLVLVLILAGCESQTTSPPSPLFAGQTEDQATWTMILALLAPLVIATFKQSGLSKEANSLIALGLCLVVGIADAFYFGQVDPYNVAQTVFTVISGAFASYKMIFQPFGFDSWWTEITSLIKAPRY